MNAMRRKAINDCMNRIEKIRLEIEDLSNLIENIREGEEEAFDNLPESLQESDRGEAMQEAIDNLDSALSDLEGICFDDIESYLEDAQA